MIELLQLARNDVLSAATARKAGVNAGGLARLVAAGTLHPLVRGWYSVRAPQDEKDAHWLRACAAFWRLNSTAMISHQSALIGYGLPCYQADLATVHLTKARGGTTRMVPQVKLHRAVKGLKPASDRSPCGAAIVQAGLTCGPLTALVAADAALGLKRVTQEEIDAAVALFARYAGIGPVRAVLRHVDGAHQSPGETIIAHRLRGLGWETEPQFRIETDRGDYFADLRVVGHRVLVEFDGKLKYTDPAVNYAEKQREDAIRRKHWRVVRFGWSELDDLTLIRGRVNQAIADSRL
ncbi:hypothetical protein [Intrasporangium sp. DVR]|uniref:hypothetical protein n=1 Tax=Intrasporangium sp. DVR TaxID=3127867 RepID=UPI00313A5B27